MHFALISRRSRFRAGTRYFRRGVDSEGHVANFNETEQLLFVETPNASIPLAGDEFASRLSFVQIRGSIPLCWAEVNTVRYKPDLQIMDTKDAVRPLHRYPSSHFMGYLDPCHQTASSRTSFIVRCPDTRQLSQPQRTRAAGQGGLRTKCRRGVQIYPRYSRKRSRALSQLNLPKVRYQYFDFHNECKNMRWNRISVLIDSVKDDLERYG